MNSPRPHPPRHGTRTVRAVPPPVNTPLSDWLGRWLTPVLGALTALLLLALATAPAAADAPIARPTGTAQHTLPDPTRPPSALRQAEPAASGADASAPLGSLQLQSVRLGAVAGQAPVAIINGLVVRLGGRLGEWQLQGLNDHSAWLTGPQGRLVLSLHPGIDKTRSSAQVLPPRRTPAKRSTAVAAPSPAFDDDRSAAPARSLEPR